MNESGSDHELVNMATSGIDSKSQGAQAEMMRRLKESIVEFSNTTKNFNQQISNQTSEMIRATKTIKWLTWIMVLGLLIQIWLAWPKTTWCSGPSTSDPKTYCETVYWFPHF